MGVGFKAVFKRFSRVTVSDETWAFRFERPQDTDVQVTHKDPCL